MNNILRACALTAALTLSPALHAADIQKLTQETERIAQSGKDFTMVWWMPPAFWELSLSKAPSLTAEGKEQALAALGEYTIFAVLRGQIGADGKLDARPKADLLANASLEVDGATVSPLAPDAVKPMAQAIMAGFKPGIAGMLGSFGQGIEILMYPGRKDGKLLLDPLQTGGFKYTLFDQTFAWRLPLGCLLPPLHDPKTGEEFPGNYLYNPFTGTKLSGK